MRVAKSLGKKLSVILLGAVTVSSLVVGITGSVLHILDLRHQFVESAGLQANVLATASQELLLKQDLDRASDRLLSASTFSQDHSVALFSTVGELITQFDAGEGYISQVYFKDDPSYYFSNATLHLYQPVVLTDSEKVGTLYLRLSTAALDERIARLIIVLVAIVSILLIGVWWITRKVKTSLVAPLDNLEAITYQVNASQNYSLRVPVTTNDEIGRLSRTVNKLFETIEAQQRERDAAEGALMLNKRRLERAVKDLQYLANYDALTELPNRALCMDRMRYALKHASRHGNKVGILFLDLDHFKDVNDSLGHAIGDELLKAASNRINGLIREEDTLARLGGDEFVIILPDIENSDDIILLVEKLVDGFNRQFELSDAIVTSTMSVGVCVYPNDGLTVDALMKAADTAMYKAKEVGRNTYAFYESTMNDLALRRHRIANDLRDAITNNELFLVYQPKARLDTGAICGAEALLRWQHPVLGAIPPDEFVPIAESIGLINQIGQWVLESASRDALVWQQHTSENLLLSVNLSPVQFRQSNLPEIVADSLASSGFPAKNLELEITESMLMRDLDSSVKSLQRLKRLGVTLAIDDFGTGYSSLSYLRRFPLDFLKIDRTFIDEVCDDPDDLAITLAIISMAKSLRLQVIAEGVETFEQWNFLANHACDQAQGYLISKGLKSDDFIQFIETYKPPGTTN